MRTLYSVGLGTIALLACMGANSAIVVPPINAYGDIYFSNPAYHATMPNPGGLGFVRPNIGTAFLELDDYPAITAQATVEKNARAPTTSRAFGNFYYFMAVTGPSPSVSVNVAAKGSIRGVSDNASGSFVLESSWKLTDPSLGSDDPAFEVVGDAIGITNTEKRLAHSDHFDSTHSLTLATDHLYEIELHAYAKSIVQTLGAQTTANAVIDPVFSLADGVDPNSYSLQFSKDIRNTFPIPNPIPLPGAAFEMISGLIALGWLRRLFPV